MKCIYNTGFKFVFWVLQIFFVLGVGWGLSEVFDISFLLALHIIVIALLIEIQMEVDGLESGRRYLENMIRSRKFDVREETRKQQRKEENE